MTDKQVLSGVILYLILFAIDKREEHGKRGRKGILKTIKKQLAIYATENKERYLYLVNSAEKIMDRAYKDLNEEDAPINPGTIIMIMEHRHKDYLSAYDLKKEHVDSLKDAYAGGRASFMSMKMGNKYVEQIDIFLKEEQDGE